MVTTNLITEVTILATQELLKANLHKATTKTILSMCDRLKIPIMERITKAQQVQT